MAAKRIRRDFEPISELFGDVVQDRPCFLYADDDDPRLRIEALAAPSVAEEPAVPHPTPEPEKAAAPPPPPPADVPPARGAAAKPRSSRVIFKDDRGLLTGVVVLHGFITVLTLGLWRFWQKTEQRQVVWSHTVLDEEPLEYLGRGVELLLGALIAIVFLGGMLAAAQLSMVFLGLAAMPDLGAAPSEMIPLFLAAAVALPPLVQYATFRARRYRLARTRWRGLRFGMEGSGLSLAGLWALWAPAVLLSGGLFYPFWRWSRERHMTRRTVWGRERFGFEGSAVGLFLHWLPAWLLVAGAVGAASIPGVREALELTAAHVGRSLGFGFGYGTMAAALLGGAVFALALAVLALNYKAAETRLFWRARRLLGARAECDFSVWSLVDAFMAVMGRNAWPGGGVWLLSVAVMALCVFGAISIEAGGGQSVGVTQLDALGEALFGVVGGSWRAQAVLMLGIGVTYALSAVFSMWLWTAVYARRVHAHVCDSLTVHGLETLEDARGRRRDANGDAEGFADALDVGGAF